MRTCAERAIGKEQQKKDKEHKLKEEITGNLAEGGGIGVKSC